ncbi:hypothetical protein HZA33_03690 [Candidatus Pacearchaeota archaeon]|nr:hypothetical protein [Candidatus Pacearchaeota archaeon]
MKKITRIDIKEIFELCKEMDKSKKFSEQFNALNKKLDSLYGIQLSEQVMLYSRDKYHQVTDVPHIFIRIANTLIKEAAKDSEVIKIENPSALYNLCAGLNADISVLVRGDVGSFFASTVKCGEYHISGNAGRSLLANATAGKCVVEGDADEGAGYCNQGANILIKGNSRPRTGIQMRAGNIITLESLVFGSGLYMAGGNILCLGEKIGKGLGPGMVGGNIYVPYLKEETLGIGTQSSELSSEDYKCIENMLLIFNENLGIEKISDSKFKINGKEYDFQGYKKIIAKK